MFSKLTVSALVLALSAGAVSAQGASSAGEDMLALNNGVAPGAYTLSELTRLDHARRDANGASEVRYILDHAQTSVADRANTPSAGLEITPAYRQRALSVGVEPGKYSAADITRIELADRNNDRVGVSYLSDPSRNTETGASVASSPARDQIAASLNVNATDFTLAQLVSLKAAVRDADQSSVRAILANSTSNATAATVLN